MLTCTVCTRLISFTFTSRLHAAVHHGAIRRQYRFIVHRSRQA